MTLPSDAAKENPAASGVCCLPKLVAGPDRYSLQRLKTSEPLVPPKPNEFDSA